MSALGAAVLAMAAVTDAQVDTLARSMARPGKVTHPDPELTERYAALSELQGEIYGRLLDLFPRLH